MKVTAIDRAEMNTGKETCHLSKFCQHIQTETISFYEVVREAIPNYYLKLSDKNRLECLALIREFFNDLDKKLGVSKSWHDVATVLEGCSLYCYFDGTNFYGPSSDRIINACVCEYLGIFYLSLAMKLFPIREEILNSEPDEIHLSDLFALSDENIIDLLNKHSKSQNSLAAINFLSRFKKFLQTDKSGKSFLHYEFRRQRIYKIQRDTINVSKWIRNSMDQLTPLIGMKNKEQKEGLRIFFVSQVADKKLLIDDLDEFINGRFYILGSNFNSITKSNFCLTLGESGIPTEVIREIFTKIQNLGTENSIRNIQKWIFHLFFDYEGEGFSMHNIKKVTESIRASR